MWRNYLTVGVRALAKNKTYAFINIFGLALGLAACLMILLFVRYELSFAYPFLGLSYVVVYLGATRWEELAEPATPLRTIGTLFVVAGVALLSFAGPRAPERVGPHGGRR